jgi:hypothetical protein
MLPPLQEKKRNQFFIKVFIYEENFPEVFFYSCSELKKNRAVRVQLGIFIEFPLSLLGKRSQIKENETVIRRQEISVE